MSDQILIVDDEPEIADLIDVYLRSENYTVYKFYSGLEAVAFIDRHEPDLAILDLMLPDTDGFTLCKHIREKYNYPVIMLTAKDEEIDKITGLAYGADDYITKPFRPLEMVARVKAQLRRYKKYNASHPDAESGAHILSHACLTMNLQTHECFLEDKPLVLTPTEFEILRILLEHKGSVVNSEALFHEVWQDEYYSKSNNTITAHIRHLREKMHDTAEHPKYIKTVWGVGYSIHT